MALKGCAHSFSVAKAEGAVTVRSHVQARHVAGDRYWMVGGIYTHRLVRTASGWRINALAIKRLYEEGDRRVLETRPQARKSEAAPLTN